jgi:hypothetical protein
VIDRAVDARVARVIMGLNVDPVPFYSTDIKAAWQVIEHLSGKQIVTCVMDQLGYDDTGAEDLWRVQFMIWFPPAQSETAPMAICLAALEIIVYD